MAIHDHGSAASRTAKALSLQFSNLPHAGLFVKTVVPSGSVSHAFPCSLLPPHALSSRLGRRSALGDEQNGHDTCTFSQLVVSTETTLHLHVVDRVTECLVSINRIPVFGRVRALNSVVSSVTGQEYLVVLSENSKVSFLQYDGRTDSILCSGSEYLRDPPVPHSFTSPRRDARLLAVHSQKRILAVATLESTILVFPVLFLPTQTSAGKIVSSAVDGVVLSLDFLEDDGNDNTSAILLALVQRGPKQHIAVYSIDISPDPGGGSLSITCLGGMCTGASRHEDLAAARAHSKLTGQPVKPPPHATSLSKLQGCPYVYFVCLEGRVIVADAFPIISNCQLSRNFHAHANQPLASSRDYLQSEGSSYSPSTSSDGPQVARRHTASSSMPACTVGSPAGIVPEEQRQILSDLTSGTTSGSAAISESFAYRSPTGSTPSSSSGQNASGNDTLQSDSGTHRDPDSARLLASHQRDFEENVEHSDQYGDGGTLQTQMDVGNMPSAAHSTMSSEQTSAMLDSVTFTGVGPVSASTAASSTARADTLGFTSRALDVAARTGALDPSMSYLAIPPHIALEIGDGLEGAVVAFSAANIHFSCGPRDAEGRFANSATIPWEERDLDRCTDRAEQEHAGGSYLVTESGNLYALRWSTVMHRDGVSCYVIPNTVSGCNTSQRKSRSLSHSAPRFYSLDCVGHVGPAVALASLDLNLLFIANDGADGSLRRVCVSEERSSQSSSKWLHQRCRRYEVGICQEYLNLAPISDFVVIQSACCQGNCRQVRCPPDFGHCGSDRHDHHGQVSVASSKADCSTFPDGTSRTFCGVDVGSDRYEERDSTRQERSESDSSGDRHNGSVMKGPYSPRRQRIQTSRNMRTSDSRKETELIVGSGLGRNGTVRLLRFGVPVSVFSVSAPMFPSCNGMWSVAPRSISATHNFLVLSFAESTGVFFTAPSAANEVPGKLADLIDGSEASSFILTQRTICAGRVNDGVLAQVYHYGVRFIVLAKADELLNPPQRRHGVVQGAVAQNCYDWNVPVGGYVSAGCIGAGYVVLAMLQPNKSPELVLLQYRNVAADATERGPRVVSVSSLGHEVSAMSLPTWYDDAERGNFGASCSPARIRPVFIMATYAPGIEIRALRADMSLLARVVVDPSWNDLPIPMKRDACQEMFHNIAGYFEVDEHADHGARCSDVGDSACTDAGCATRGKHNGDLSSLGTRHVGPVLESLCAVCVSGRCLVFAGSRDGHVLKYDIVQRAEKGKERARSSRASELHSWQLKLISRRQLGLKPVRVSVVHIASGKAILAECERPWLLCLVSNMWRWMPTNFAETRAATSFSVPGASRCIAFVADDDKLYLCGIRRLLPVSVSTINVGDTPSRVLPLNGKSDNVLVATSREDISSPGIPTDEFKGYLRRGFPRSTQALAGRRGHGHLTSRDNFGLPDIRDSCSGIESTSDIRLFSGRNRTLTSRMSLLPGELVHVLLQWTTYIVVGTSIDLRRSYSQKTPIRDRGRLLLLAVENCNLSQDIHGQSRASSSTFHENDVPYSQHTSGGREAGTESSSIRACCEVVLPGAMLAGAVSEAQDMLVASSNEHIFVFGLCNDKLAIAEVARVSTRMLVVSISLYRDMICVADRRDSAAFYRIDFQSRRLVRDRGDFRKRMIADIVSVDRYTAIATDKQGYLLSLSYENSDRAHLPRCDPSIVSDVATRCQSDVFDSCHYSDMLAHNEFPQLHGLDALFDIASMQDDEHEEVVDSNNAPSSSSGSEDEEEGDGLDGDGMAPMSVSFHAQNDEMVQYDVPSHALAISGNNHDAGENAGADSENTADHPDMMEPSNAQSAEGAAEIDDESDDTADDENDVEDDEGPGDDQMIDEESSIDTNAQRSDVPQPVQRNLQCEHTFNLNDTALRLRMRRNISICNGGDRDPEDDDPFWASRSNTVVVGSLSGAIFVCVPTSREEFRVLQNVAAALSTCRSIVGIAVSSSHDHFRSAYGKSATGTVDGDLLELFCSLDLPDQLAVASAAGYDGIQNVHRISALIDDLCDHTT